VTPLAAWLEEVEAQVRSYWIPEECPEFVPTLVGLLRLAIAVRDEALKVAIRGQQALDFANESFGVKPGEEKPYYAPELAAALAAFDAAVAARGKETT